MIGRRFHFSALLQAILRPIDPTLGTILFGLLVYAVIVQSSAAPDLISKQILLILLALVLMWVVASIPAQRLLSIAPALYVACVALLVLVNLFGEVSKGAQRWLNLGFIRVQPSEVMKIAMPMALAWFFQKREGFISWQEFFVAMVLLLVPVALIAKQPDLGTAVLVCAAGIYVIFFAGLSWKLIAPVVIVGAVAIGAFAISGDQLCQSDIEWPGMREYQKQRVCTLLDPTRDPLGKGFHIIQSTIAIGSGGFDGKGWREGTQTHLAFLPERHTDFVFAVLSEEFGFLGALVLLGLYLALLVRGFFIAAAAQTLGSRLLAGAMTMIFFTYVFVNIGMVSGILPVVGVPLPFISYGGTALVTLCIGLGILMSIRRNWQDR
ncbi:MAG: rod shape-determining protein RodA [Azoarcus sp.]|jgi:rod shape determining protein RodA|nr:rod shape-determining protein RodA [Azoarcus sp.]